MDFIRDDVLLMQHDGVGVDRLSFGIVDLRHFSRCDDVNHLGFESGAQRFPFMREPFVVGGPEAGCDEDRKFRQARSEDRIVAQELAKLLGSRAKLRTVQPGAKGCRNAAALARCGLVGNVPLRFVHLSPLLSLSLSCVPPVRSLLPEAEFNNIIKRLAAYQGYNIKVNFPFYTLYNAYIIEMNMEDGDGHQ